jgi:hypothetical protein
VCCCLLDVLVTLQHLLTVPLVQKVMRMVLLGAQQMRWLQLLRP